MKRAEKEKRGFTLAELLVVVVIIGVLVAISIPIFTTQLEKARRSVDLYNARAVESVLVNAINDGSVQLAPGTDTNDSYGIWVTMKREGNGNWPQNYSQSGNVFYGVNPGIIINGHANTGNWNSNNTELQNIVKANGIDVDNLKVNCRKSDSQTPALRALPLNQYVLPEFYPRFAGFRPFPACFPPRSSYIMSK